MTLMRRSGFCQGRVSSPFHYPGCARNLWTKTCLLYFDVPLIKTRVIEYRSPYLVQNDIDLESILLLVDSAESLKLKGNWSCGKRDSRSLKDRFYLNAPPGRARKIRDTL
jgi:hypothetical protein